ncbi:MAG: phage major capsid protein [Acidaminobacter sp.]|uniref:phage major capsid protein n=1 Tax=Acidaminobacter sp. TaxID=1872102 RepID=UPI001385A369|nr:phage major capsid protein [Acidaminobacter sp.]MZQ99485.1 phage major capsid protein [Acidaminobacter sp.]
MPATLSTLDSVLKTQYLGPIREQLNNDNELLKRIDTDFDSVVGKNFTIPMHYGRNEGIGARAEGATLMDAGQQAYKESIVPMRYLYGRIQLTGQSIKAAKNDAGAFIRAVDSEIKGVTRDLKNAVNRMLAGDGTGRLTTCGTTSASTTVVVASTAFLRAGMSIDVLVAADGTTGTGAVGRTVVSVTNATSFVISGAAITTNNTYAVYVGGSRNLEVMGIQGIVDNADIGGGYGALQQLAVASYPWHKASILANGGSNRAISDTLLQTLIDTVEQAGAGDVSALYTTYGVRRAYQAVLDAKKQIVNKTELKGGYSTIAFNNLPIIVDKFLPANKVFGVDESMLKMYKLADYDWMDMDGAILSRVTGKDAYEAILYCYMELGMFARNAFGRLDDITEV